MSKMSHGGFISIPAPDNEKMLQESYDKQGNQGKDTVSDPCLEYKLVYKFLYMNIHHWRGVD